jgi:serine/threonine protein kinase
MRTLHFNYVIGAGAMGTVYHAELRVPGGFTRQCAVKVMQTGAPDVDHFRERMRDEARLLGMLQDEQILGVAEMVQVDGRDAVIMEYVEGADLSDLMAVGRCPPRALAELGAELAGCLHRAHTAVHPNTGEHLKVIHRDIKPANIMVTARGGVRLLDFGVARAAFDARESQTRGLVLGTLNYFPPEILAGGEPTPAVDIYGLALTLWECATGHEWGSPQVRQNRFERRVDQRLGVIEEEYKALIPVLRQMLQWDPQRRSDGGTVERALLASADKSSGGGLRTWARDVVPPIIAGRDRSKVDALVGQNIKVVHESTVDDTAPLKPMNTSALVASRADQEPTYNDLAPPSAVKRASADGPKVPGSPSTVLTPVTRRRPPKKPNLFLWFGGATLVGLAAGLVVLFCLILVMLLVTR